VAISVLVFFKNTNKTVSEVFGMCHFYPKQCTRITNAPGLQ